VSRGRKSVEPIQISHSTSCFVGAQVYNKPLSATSFTNVDHKARKMINTFIVINSTSLPVDDSH